MQYESLIEGEDQPGSDAVVLTRLAHKLGERLPLLCAEKLLYDGREDIPGSAVPTGVAQDKFPVYNRFRQLGRTNMARPIVNAVVSRQRPNGFRLVGAAATRDTAANDEYSQCRMDMKIPRAAHYTALHGRAYYVVSGDQGADHVTLLSPFECVVNQEETAAVSYTYLEDAGREYLTLYRKVRSETGQVSVYTRVASRETEARTLVGEDNDDEVKNVAEKYLSDTEQTKTWVPEIGWEWESGPVILDYATACQTLPVIEQRAPDGKGQVSPHFSSMLRIDQGVFDRMCIVTVQSFRQRAIKGMKHLRYTESDPQVLQGMKKAGDPIDFDSVFEVGPNALWMLPEDTEMWESATTDIRPLLEAVKDDIKSLASASETPLDILSPDVSGSASGADLKREGIVFKVEALNRLANDALVRVLRMALVLDGHTEAVDRQYAVQWLAPELRTWGNDIADAASKLVGVLPKRSIWTIVLGMTEQEIAEAEQNMTNDAFSQFLTTPTTSTESTGEDITALTGESLGLPATPDFEEALGGSSNSTPEGE